MFRVFHTEWLTYRTQTTFVTGWRNAALWLVDLIGVDQRWWHLLHDKLWKAKSVAQSRPALYFSQQFSSTPQQMFLLQGKLITQGGKTWNIDAKLATKQCCAASWGFLYPVFRRLKHVTFSSHLRKPQVNIWHAWRVVSLISTLIVSTSEKIPNNITVVVWRQVKWENSSLPAASCGWKTSVVTLVTDLPHEIAW